ncbi:EGF domain-specific O-linked N-acetylglucosamine transferase-like isoform X1 [Saccostrea echinata]|uniref:EGF domain-specific O-linked N-acetylglucosamine transferase-like isoform X1 n=1 Tax=Saccostrea echinata TaxID=191078 RepID=UPI002A81389F|nr:EGF domain-specific O-linked N-acetylglucosamine transferase-like isoform X1 [Saccostrea echinata]XP_061195476.1 EGF domain-specific O-linked N-acetylglucosamine transferase-like isoform X1 [Saccostrea echinata]
MRQTGSALLWFLFVYTVACWVDYNLPKSHLSFFLRNNPEMKQRCQEDEACPYKGYLNETRCWGYEDYCDTTSRLNSTTCPEGSRGWTKGKAEQLDLFWKSVDFGYILERKQELKTFCEPKTQEDSSLECVRYTRFCRGRNLFFDFTKPEMFSGQERFKENLFDAKLRFAQDEFNTGVIGGHCDLDKEALKAEGDHKSALQSWFAEVEHFSSLPFRPIQDGRCDIILDKPTYFMKLDAGVNMYHHFCDFINLYASNHLNNSFSTDVYVVMWDTSTMGYTDLFTETWKAFTDYPIIRLHKFTKKTLCVREAVFSLLPRMRYGMYYNQPLVPGCSGSSFFEAFNQHLAHRLKLTQHGPLESKIRITLLSRKTKYRNILNEDELRRAMITVGEFDVKVVTYNRDMPFMEQIETSYNSDIFIGIHGAGLTHLLFQPDWAVVIELYNCEDDSCYHDLARSRGIHYMTWEKPSKVYQEDEGHHPTLGAHAKFTNYEFDVSEFMRLILNAAEYVRSHPKFIQGRQSKYSEGKGKQSKASQGREFKEEL